MRTSILRNALRNGAVCQSDGMALCSYLYLRPNITWNFCRNETATATVWLSAPTTFVSQIHNNTNTNRPISSNRSAKFTTWKKKFDDHLHWLILFVVSVFGRVIHFGPVFTDDSTSWQQWQDTRCAVKLQALHRERERDRRTDRER